MRTSTKALMFAGTALVVIALFGGAISASYILRFKNATKNITVNEVNISQLGDGKYYGSYKVYHVSADVEVAVKDGKVTNIYIVDASMEKDLLEGVAREVIKKQSLKGADTVTGATVSQKAVLKAVEDALEGKPE